MLLFGNICKTQHNTDNKYKIILKEYNIKLPGRSVNYDFPAIDLNPRQRIDLHSRFTEYEIAWVCCKAG